MQRLFVSLLLVVSFALAACQSSEGSKTKLGAITFCDRLIAWEPIDGEPDAERAVTRAEACAMPAGNGVWMQVEQVHSKRRGRVYWLWMRSDDPHLGISSQDQKPVLAGWALQARPFSWAHEIVAVRSASNSGASALLNGSCPRKAVGKQPDQRYCIANR